MSKDMFNVSSFHYLLILIKSHYCSIYISDKITETIDTFEETTSESKDSGRRFYFFKLCYFNVSWNVFNMWSLQPIQILIIYFQT